MRIIDLVIGIGLTVIGAFIGLIMLSLITQLGGLSVVCEGVTPDGTRCSSDFLTGMVILGTAIVVFGWFLPAGFLVVRALRRRLVFFLPIIGIVVMFAAFYLIAALINAMYSPA